MKKRVLVELIRDVVQPHLADLTHNDLILYAKPVNSILRGVIFSTKLRDADAFMASIFARPLFVPSAAPIGPWGNYARRGFFDPREVWYIAELESAGARARLVRSIQRNLVVLPSVASPLLFARNAARKFGRVNTDTENHAIGLSFARCGDLVEARNRLQRVLSTGPAKYDNSDRIASARKMVELIDAGKVEEVRSLLDSWESDTVTQLESQGFKMDKVAAD